MFFDTLCEALDPKSGKILPIEQLQKSEYSHIAFDIAYKGNFHFIVLAFHNGSGHYYVERNSQCISSIYHFNKIDDNTIKRMQRMINEIDNGKKYRNKKTLSEKITSAARQKGLVSYMNNTKWNELTEAIKADIPDTPLQYKTVFEDDPPDWGWTSIGDEDFVYMNFAAIEWLKIRHIITETTHIGALVPPEVHTYDKKNELLRIFQKYNIPYEYDEDEQAFVVYGYK